MKNLVGVNRYKQKKKSTVSHILVLQERQKTL